MIPVLRAAQRVSHRCKWSGLQAQALRAMTAPYLPEGTPPCRGCIDDQASISFGFKSRDVIEAGLAGLLKEVDQVRLPHAHLHWAGHDACISSAITPPLYKSLIFSHNDARRSSRNM